MDWTRWKREPDKAIKALTNLPDGSVMTTRGCKIYIPERYIEKQLASIGADTYIAGIFAIVVDDQFYGVSTTNAMMRVSSTANISTVKFGDDSYLEFAFDPGSIVFPTVSLIKSDTLVYYIFDEFIAKGRVPWYIGYEDLAQLFDSADRHAGVSLNRYHSILEMFAAAIGRNPEDRAKYYRHSIASQDDPLKRPPKIIALRAITYGATNTTAKLMGSHWGDGLTSALVNPSEKQERIEELLRR